MNPEIEKAIDEYGYAIELAVSNTFPKVSPGKEATLYAKVQSKREHLMQLIEWLAQYQPREVSNE